MSAAIETPAKCEVRSVIRFFVAKQYSAAEIHRELCTVYGPNVMSAGVVREWVRAFKSGRTNVHDEERSGRPSVVTDDLVGKIDEKIRDNRRFTISQLSEEFPQISRTVLYEVVSERLGYRKFCARWVPKILSETHKTQRMTAALDFLTRYDQGGESFMNRIVTGDETWIKYVNPETKEQSKVWGHTASPHKPTKARQGFSGRKLMATVFWDSKGVLLVEFMERGATINADSYVETLKNLRRAIQNKRRGLLSSGVVFLHDNARPHAAQKTKDLLGQFKWDVFSHPPYSPDLAPSDYFLFMHMKKWLGSQRFEDDEELKDAVNGWLKAQAGDFFSEGISKLVSRYDKCLNVQGNYVEK
jgi:[histone H3]-lysine36 N-dimethyltransferase SETMAR